MVKLRNVQAYPTKNVPDHIVQECHDTAEEMCKLLELKFEGKSPNMILGAISFIHASLIKTCVVEEPKEISNATRNAMIALVKNIETLTGVDVTKEHE
jgi:hypothetical protein